MGKPNQKKVIHTSEVKKATPGTDQRSAISTKGWLYYLLLAILGLLIYSNCYDCAFQLDDKHNITDNPAIRDIGSTKEMWDLNPGRFLPFYSFALNYHFGEFEVGGYHVVNVLIHLINSFFVFWFVNLLFKTPNLRNHALTAQSKSIALAVALLFVSHPLATGAVTYIVQRMASMVAMFYILTLCLYIKGRLSENQKTKLNYWGAAFLSMVMAMLSKENSFTIPMMILFIEIALFNTKSNGLNFKNPRTLAAVTGILLIFGLSIYLFADKILKPLPPSIYNAETITPWNYLLTQFSVIVKYIQLLIVPINQNVDYDFPVSNHLLELSTLFSMLFLLALLVLAIILFNKYRLITFGIIWFFLTLSIESSIIPISDVIFEHRAYIPSIGYFTILSFVIFYLMRNKEKVYVWGLIIILVSVHATLAFQRNKVWKDEISLWTDAISKSPGKARPYINRGYAFGKMQRWNQSIQDFQKVNELFPNQHATAFYNLGIAYWALGDKKKSLENYSKAIQIDPKNAESVYARGVCYHFLNEPDKAISDYTKTIALNPVYDKAFYSRGLLYGAKKMWNEAIQDYSKGIEINPGNFNFYFNRALAYGNIGQWDKAIVDLNKVIELDPKNKSAYSYRDMAQNKLKEGLNLK